MTHYVGLDVSMKSVFVCILDQEGNISREVELPTEPAAIHSFLAGTSLEINKIGLETGNMTHWLTKGLRGYGYEVHPMESRKMAAILATVINKTDQNDARGIAEALRAGHYHQCVHRSDGAMELRTALHARDLLVKQRTQTTNSIRGFLKVYGVKLKKGRGADFPELVREAVSELAIEVRVSMESLLSVLAVLSDEIGKLDRVLEKQAKTTSSVQLLKTIDGIGTITALAYVGEIDEVDRFKSSRDVAAYLGLTPRQYSSGEITKQGRVSKQGSSHLRGLLIESATVLLTRCQSWSPIKSWGLKLMKKKGKRKAIVAVARKLAVIMHSMLKNGAEFNRKGKTAMIKDAHKKAKAKLDKDTGLIEQAI
ncbi:Transposase for insertion sequence element IS1111A [Chlamydiales bacterium SCGC AG-110-P3]|nr:Transposase for insertion sequence element IS1111A [Chlamydiales bacterium SCGC AG-110-P3]